MGRTIPTWRIVVEQKITELGRFKQFLRSEDRAVFDDLLTQCKLYASPRTRLTGLRFDLLTTASINQLCFAD